MKKSDFLNLGNKILDLIGENSLEFFNFGGGAPKPGIVTSRTGTLVNSILGGKGNPEHIRKVEFTGDSLELTIGTKVPYAALLEKGGIRIVTDKMRRFFWAKYFETQGEAINEMWSALRFKNEIVYQPRPYLRPAVEKSIPMIKELFTKEMMKFVELSITETITGKMKARPLET